MTGRRVVVASANPKKAAEIAELLSGWEPVPRPAEMGDVVEDAPDFVGNARLKSRAVAEFAGEAALADDSGLEVEALGGLPGVRSARFAADHDRGEPGDDAANLALLVERMRGVTDRRARFRSVVVLTEPDGTEWVADGSVEGTLLDDPRGAGGFGYDPLFVPEDGDGRTFAEMSGEEKAALSHRGRALRALAAQLDD